MGLAHSPEEWILLSLARGVSAGSLRAPAHTCASRVGGLTNILLTLRSRMLVAGDSGPPSQSRGGRLDRGKEVGFHVEGKISILFLNIFNGESERGVPPAPSKLTCPLHRCA